MKISKISQYAKLLVVVLGMALIAVSCSKDKNNELVGTTWEGEVSGLATLYAEFISNTEVMMRAEVGDTPLFSKKISYSYNPPRITVIIPADPILSVASIPAGTYEGTVDGNTMTFVFEGNTVVLTKK